MSSTAVVRVYYDPDAQNRLNNQKQFESCAKYFFTAVTVFIIIALIVMSISDSPPCAHNC